VREKNRFRVAMRREGGVPARMRNGGRKSRDIALPPDPCPIGETRCSSQYVRDILRWDLTPNARTNASKKNEINYFLFLKASI